MIFCSIGPTKHRSTAEVIPICWEEGDVRSDRAVQRLLHHCLRGHSHSLWNRHCRLQIIGRLRWGPSPRPLPRQRTSVHPLLVPMRRCTIRCTIAVRRTEHEAVRRLERLPVLIRIKLRPYQPRVGEAVSAYPGEEPEYLPRVVDVATSPSIRAVGAFGSHVVFICSNISHRRHTTLDDRRRTEHTVDRAGQGRVVAEPP